MMGEKAFIIAQAVVAYAHEQRDAELANRLDKVMTQLGHTQFYKKYKAWRRIVNNRGRSTLQAPSEPTAQAQPDN